MSLHKFQVECDQVCSVNMDNEIIFTLEQKNKLILVTLQSTVVVKLTFLLTFISYTNIFV